MKRALFFTFLLAWWASACTVGPVNPVAPPIADPVGCPQICAHLRENKCPAGEPTLRGRTCEDVCIKGLESGLVNFDADCMVHLVGCDDSVCARETP